LGTYRLGIPHSKGYSRYNRSSDYDYEKKKIEELNMSSIRRMIRECKPLRVKFYACSTTMEMMGLRKEDLLDEADEYSWSHDIPIYCFQGCDCNACMRTLELCMRNLMIFSESNIDMRICL